MVFHIRNMVGDAHPTTNNQQPITNNQQQTTNNKQPTTNNQLNSIFSIENHYPPYKLQCDSEKQP